MVLARVFTIGDATIICVRLVTIVRCVAEEWLRLNRLSARRASPAGTARDYGPP